jgi:nucleotide-binding universal stress UspA family protein
MGSYWKIPLSVITVEEIGRTSPGVQRLAKDYLKRRNVEASFITASGNVSEMILTSAEGSACDLIIMGGYGRGPMMEMVLGSTVDHVLQNSRIPVLICR